MVLHSPELRRWDIIQADQWSRMVHSTYNTKEEAEKAVQEIYNTEYYVRDGYTSFFIEEHEEDD